MSSGVAVPESHRLGGTNELIFIAAAERMGAVPPGTVMDNLSRRMEMLQDAAFQSLQAVRCVQWAAMLPVRTLSAFCACSSAFRGCDLSLRLLCSACVCQMAGHPNACSRNQPPAATA